MNEKRSIYDTDPLDETVAHRARSVFDKDDESEAQTRRFADYEARATAGFDIRTSSRKGVNRYGSAPVKNNSTDGFADSYPSVTEHERARGENHKRIVERVGIAENLLTTAAYAPVFLGFVVSILELAFLPRAERRARFHAAQALAMHVAVFAFGFVVQFAGNLTRMGLGDAGASLFKLATIILTMASSIYFVVMMMRAWKGEAREIEALKDATKWLNEKIEPVK